MCEIYYSINLFCNIKIEKNTLCADHLFSPCTSKMCYNSPASLNSKKLPQLCPQTPVKSEKEVKEKVKLEEKERMGWDGTHKTRCYRHKVMPLPLTVFTNALYIILKIIFENSFM